MQGVVIVAWGSQAKRRESQASPGKVIVSLCENCGLHVMYNICRISD